ncbi:MAG TPA: phospholipase D-like domain-containing protein [Thermoanaerobaculia bacterium]
MTAARVLEPVLRPRAGRRLPKELSPRRACRLAEALPQGIHDPGFPELLERIDTGAFHPGNRVEVFFSGADAFASMLAAVAEAREEVLLESYIFKHDATGQQFADALSRAADRGVSVRVLADGFGSWATRRAFWDALRSHGVEVRLFHPLWSPIRYLPFRDHRKILVVDRRVGYTGGMNIGEEYGSSALPARTSTSPSLRVWRDTHARVEGTAAWEMAVVFEEGWRHSRGEPLGLPPLTLSPATAHGARVLVLDSRAGRGAHEVASVFAAIAGAARRTLWITTAYFAPRRRAIAILGATARRGVDVRLLLPGPSDVPLVRHAGHGFFATLLSRSVRIFEYQAAILHAKTVVADGLLSVVGSSNLDLRSFEANAECNDVILDRETAAVMEARFQEDLTRSVEIVRPSWRRRRAFHRFFDAAARRLSPLL